MKDEIKEILNNANKDTKFKMVDENGAEKEMNLAGFIEQLLNDNKTLLDCITNLQEEIERQSKAQVILDNQIAEMWKYKQRNEKAIEDLEKIKELNDKHILARDNIIIHLDIDHIEYLLNILKGDKDE